LITGSHECIIIETCLSHWKRIPFFWVDFPIDIDDIEILVHPELVSIVANKNSPVLSGIRISVDLLGDHLAQSSLFSKPLASKATDRMPTHSHWPGWVVGLGRGDGNHAFLSTEAEGMFERKFTLMPAALLSENAR
jgi:hypothetical protein